MDVLGDPSVTRDFVYAEDLAKACILLSAHNFKGIINFSSGNPFTIKQLAKKIIKILKVKKKIKFTNKSKSSAKYRVLDNSKFNKLFKDFKRKNLKDGLRETIKWYLNYEKQKF